jgi:chromosome segregation ATPase
MADIDTTKETTETGAKTNPPPPPPNPGSIDDQLKALKRELDELEGNLSVQSKHRDALKADFAALEKSAGDAKKSPDEYEQGLEGLKEGRKKLDEEYYQPKYPVVTGALGPAKVKTIVDEITKIDKAINDIKSESELKEAVKKAREKYEAAAEVLENAQKDYDKLKNLLKASQDNIKKMQGWRETIEKFDDKNDFKSMYVYLRELRGLLDDRDTNPRTKDEYSDELETAWSKLNTAKNNARDLQAEWDTAKNALAQAEAERKRLKESRISDILEKIRDV